MERARTQTIREFILDQAAMNPRGLARRIAEAYGISRQAANRHLDLLVETGMLEQSGQTRARTYRLRRTSSLSREVRVTPVLNAERLWEDHIAAILDGDAPTVRDACRGTFSELVRSAAGHRGATWIQFSFANTARDIDITVADDGDGVFEELTEPLGASSPRESAEILANLANARSTDSPLVRLVLAARSFGSFHIRSGGIALGRSDPSGAWSVTDENGHVNGTVVSLRMRRPSASSAAVTRRRGSATTR
jgi:DNA-binding transcriptional ArsR family regulator